MTDPAEPVAENEKPADGELNAVVDSRDLSTMVAVDFEGTDTPELCEWCSRTGGSNGSTSPRATPYYASGTSRTAALSPNGKKRIPKYLTRTPGRGRTLIAAERWKSGRGLGRLY